MAAKLTNSSEESSMGSDVYFSRRVFTENLVGGGGCHSREGTHPAASSRLAHAGVCSAPEQSASAAVGSRSRQREQRGGLGCGPVTPLSPRPPRDPEGRPLLPAVRVARKGEQRPPSSRPCAAGDGFPFLPPLVLGARRQRGHGAAGRGGPGQVSAGGMARAGGHGCLRGAWHSSCRRLSSSEGWRRPMAQQRGLEASWWGSRGAPQ